LEQGSTIRFAGFSADGTWVASSDNATFSIWDSRTWQQIPLKPNDLVSASDAEEGFSKVIFSQDDKAVATMTVTYPPCIWNTSTGNQICPPLRVVAETIAFSPDGKEVATVSGQWATRIWDVSAGEPLSPLFGANVKDLIFNPNGRQIMTIGDQVQLWSLPPATAAPPWLADVLEAAAGQFLNDRGILEELPAERSEKIRLERLASTSRDPWEIFGRELYSGL
jgi:WD40 repeat protein